MKGGIIMNEALLTLKPWLPALGAFCFFTFLRYVYKHFLLRLLRRLTNVISFKNIYYLHHYSFIKDIEMIFCTVLGRRMRYDNEII